MHRCITDAANVKIFPCKQLPKKLNKAGKLLQSRGFTKCALPFGVLVVGKSTLKDSGILKFYVTTFLLFIEYGT